MAAPPTDSFTTLETNITTAKAQSTQTPTNAASRGPSPNRGASVPDNEAIGSDSMSQKQWFESQGIDKEKWVRLKKVSHMRYQHEDLGIITGFMRGEFASLQGREGKIAESGQGQQQ